MSFIDADPPRKTTVHEIGCDLTFLSAEELALRIGLLREEITRLEQEIARKNAGRAAAENLFRSS